jgi:LmeA-like phospholipid-binding
VIGKLLSGALKLYLRSQVEGVEDLQVKIVGKSKQILQGYIPQVWLSCDRAIYQGLHFSQVQLKGTDIAVNLPEVIKHKPLKLLEAVFVEIQLRLNATDLQASLNSVWLQSGLSDLWQMILNIQNNDEFQELTNLKVEWQTIAIANSQLNFTGIYQDASGETKTIALSTGIDLANAHTLCLSLLNIIGDLPSGSLERKLEIDLGTDVALRELTIESEQILCRGKIIINS